MSASNEPLFLQFKEAVASVLEPYAGESAYAHHGQRVVMGQRLMQPASDIFLGWVTGRNGVPVLRAPAARREDQAAGRDLRRRHAGDLRQGLRLGAGAGARAGPATRPLIAGYLGSGDAFDEAMGRFAVAYADQAERDHAALKAAVRKGEIVVHTE